MFTFILIFLANALCVFALIAMHEAGHYLAGLAGGIPVRKMRIRLLTFPQHVVLLDDEGNWVPPFDLERYVAVMRRHLGSGPRLFLYTAGGLLFGTIVEVGASVTAKEAGLTGLALMIAGQSLGMYLVYVFLMDLPMALRRGYPWGDVSGLWFIAKGPAVALTAGLLVMFCCCGTCLQNKVARRHSFFRLLRVCIGKLCGYSSSVSRRTSATH
jgi:hypothetical protein